MIVIISFAFFGKGSILGSVHRKVNLKNVRIEIVFDRLWYPLSILLLAAIGAKPIGPHGGLQVDTKVCDVTGLHGLTLLSFV